MSHSPGPQQMHSLRCPYKSTKSPEPLISSLSEAIKEYFSTCTVHLYMYVSTAKFVCEYITLRHFHYTDKY